MKNEIHTVIPNYELKQFLEKSKVKYDLISYDIMRNIGQWNLENNMCFINHALQLRNFMVENRTGKIYMIDPDSFMVHDENSSS